jgi:hypothetical protein
MNPHVSTKCAGRLLIALAAIASILFAAGCGSSSTTPTNPVGFGNSSLKGTYVFSSQGTDVNGYPVAMAGTLVANGTGGTGGITGGTIDIIDQGFSSAPSTAAQSITSGSYEVASDGRGQASLTSTAYGTYVLDFVLTSTSHGLVSEFDGYGTGSGTLDLQTAVTSLSQLAAPYAFTVAGSDSNDGLFAIAGAFTLNASGVSTAGIEDFNEAGIVENESLTATATLGSGTGPGQIVLSSSSFPLTFDFYPIDATHWKLIETDYAEFVAGDVFTQTGASIPTGAMAFTMEGGITVPIAVAGFMTDNGTTVAGSEDVNNDGNVVTGTTFTGNSGAAGSVGGRVVVTLTGFNPASTVVLYPSIGGTLMLETDSANVTVGAAYAQQSVTTGLSAASQPFGFNLSAVNVSGGTGAFYEEDDIAQFTTNTSSGFSGTVDINDEGSPTSLALSGTYTLSSPLSNGGSATTTAGSSAFVSFNFYPVSDSQFLVLETDTSTSSIGAQIGVGTFELQSPPSSAAAAARKAISMVRPVVRPHAALRRK